jgi:hypothetical protein
MERRSEFRERASAREESTVPAAELCSRTRTGSGTRESEGKQQQAREREREREMRNRDVRNGRVGEEGSAVRKRVLSRIGFRISGKIKAGTGSPRNGQAILYS